MTFRPLYLYVEHPHAGEWVTVGRYGKPDGDAGYFQYARSYLDGDSLVAIDPVNLPLGPSPILALRYCGLHDVIRDACPDSWGRTLLRREFGIPESAPDIAYLLKASNADRWGALAIGTSRRPSVAHPRGPRLPQLEELTRELLAVSERMPAINSARTQGAPSPESTIGQEEGQRHDFEGAGF